MGLERRRYIPIVSHEEGAAHAAPSIIGRGHTIIAEGEGSTAGLLLPSMTAV